MNNNLDSAISTALRQPTLSSACNWIGQWLGEWSEESSGNFTIHQREWAFKQVMDRWTAPVDISGNVTNEQIADWQRIAALADAVSPWRDGDERCHCTHCSSCGSLFRTQDVYTHQKHCERLRAEMFDNRHALLARAAAAG